MIRKPVLQKDYPYMYARISAKKAKLLDQRDYDKLLKMEPNEIARNLEEGEYKKEMNELGSDYEGVRLIELALARNLSNTLSKIAEISPKSVQKILEAYLRRYDILSIKRILRWKKEGGNGSIKEMLTPVTGYTFEELTELLDKDFEEIVDSIQFESANIDYQDYLEEETELKDIEKALDEAYYAELQQIANKTGNKQFKQFIEEEIEYEKIKIILRLKRYNIEREEIEERLIEPIQTEIIEELLTAKDIEEAIKILKENEKANITNGDNLEDIEHALEVKRLEKALQTLQKDPLGLTSIIGYIVAKTTEIQNLRMLIRAKETGIQNQETIRKNLVIA